jgi:hypothetical protein
LAQAVNRLVGIVRIGVAENTDSRYRRQSHHTNLFFLPSIAKKLGTAITIPFSVGRVGSVSYTILF